MARPLLLKVDCDDKGNPVLVSLNKNINVLNKNAHGLGKTLTHVFASRILLSALTQFRMAISGTVQEVMDFNKIFKQVEGITGTSGKALDDLKNKTLAISNVTEHSSTSIAKAVLNISKMGFTIEQSLAIIPHVANLATASLVDMDTAALTAVQTMKSFNKDASEMEHIVNVIQGTVSKTAINFDDYTESMKYVAPIATTMNISLEETSAMIGKLGDVGIKGSLAGTTLKNMFLNIMRPSEDVRKVLKNLNVEGKGFNEILRALNKAGIPLSSMLETFNKRAVAGTLALSKMTDKTNLLTKALTKDEIKALDVADKIREAWILQLKTLRNAFRNVFTVMGEILSESSISLELEVIRDKFIELQEWLKKNPEALIRVTREIANFTKAIANLATNVFKILIKNGGIIFNVLKAMIALDIAEKVGIMWTNAFMKFDAAVNATGATISYAIPLLSGIALAIQVAVGYTEKWCDALDAVQKTVSDLSLEGLKNKLAALTEFQKRLHDVSERKIIKEYTGSSMFPKEILRAEEFLETLNRIAEEVGKKFGTGSDWLKGFKDVDKIIAGITKQIAEMEKELAKKTKTKTKDIVTFDLETMLDKVKDPAELWADAFINYLILRLKGKSEVVARALSNISLKYVKLLEPSETIGGLTGAQIKELGTLTPGFEKSISELPSPLPLEKMDIPELSIQTEDALKLIFAETQVLKTEKERLDIIKKLEKAKSNEVKAIEEFENTQQDLLDVEKEIAEARKNYILEQFEGFMSAAQMATNMVQMIQDSSFEKTKAQHEEQLRMFDEKAKREIDNAQGNAFKQAIISRKLAKERKKLEKEQAKMDKEQKDKQRRWAMIEVVINTAVGITQALRSCGPPASIIMAGIVAAMGFAQLALISSQENFKKGGYTGDGNPNDVAGYVHKKEFVIPERDVSALGGTNSVQKMIDDRLNGSVIYRHININIDTFIGSEEYKRQLFIDIQREAQRWE